MQIKIRIRTPPGQADMSIKEGKLMLVKKLLLRKTTVKEEYVNKDNDTLIWVVETDPGNYLKICKKIGMYEGLVQTVFKNKIVDKAIKRLADSPEDYQELKRMVKEGTKIDIIKEAIAEEIVEANKTYWDKIKETFKKK